MKRHFLSTLAILCLVMTFFVTAKAKGAEETPPESGETAGTSEVFAALQSVEVDVRLRVGESYRFVISPIYEDGPFSHNAYYWSATGEFEEMFGAVTFDSGRDVYQLTARKAGVCQLSVTNRSQYWGYGNWADQTDAITWNIMVTDASDSTADGKRLYAAPASITVRAGQSATLACVYTGTAQDFESFYAYTRNNTIAEAAPSKLFHNEDGLIGFFVEITGKSVGATQITVCLLDASQKSVVEKEIPVTVTSASGGVTSEQTLTIIPDSISFEVGQSALVVSVYSGNTEDFQYINFPAGDAEILGVLPTGLYEGNNLYVVLLMFTGKSVGTTDVTMAVLNADECSVVESTFTITVTGLPKTNSIDSVERQNGTVQVRVSCADTDAIVFCAVYANDGKMTSVKAQKITETESYVFQFDDIPFDDVKVFLLDGDLRPLCASGTA